MGSWNGQACVRQIEHYVLSAIFWRWTSPLRMFNSMRSIPLTLDLDHIPPYSMTKGKGNRCKKPAQMIRSLFVSEQMCFILILIDGNCIPGKDVLNLLFMVLDDQSSLENAFPNELTLLSEPV